MNDEDLGDEGKRRYMEGRIPLGRLGMPKVSFFFLVGGEVGSGADWGSRILLVLRCFWLRILRLMW